MELGHGVKKLRLGTLSMDRNGALEEERATVSDGLTIVILG